MVGRTNNNVNVPINSENNEEDINIGFPVSQGFSSHLDPGALANSQVLLSQAAQYHSLNNNNLQNNNQ